MIDLIYLKYLKAKSLGAAEPVYIVHGEDIMVKFHALQDAQVADSKAPNRHNDGINVGLEVGLEKKILAIMEDDPSATMGIISDKLNVTKRTVERVVKKLSVLEANVMVIGKSTNKPH